MSETGTTGAVEQEQSAKTPEQVAADAALARAGRPPEALGGPPAPRSDPDQVLESPLARLAAAERPDILVVDDEDTDDAREAVLEGRADEDDWARATEWLLGDTADVMTREMKVRVGGDDDNPLVVPWIVRAVGIDVIRSAEREAAGNRQARRNGVQYDELKANLRIVVEGTVQPDLKAAAKQQGLADATVLLQRRLHFKPGVIAQIAGEVMSLSGFDQEDVRAAGN